jgi:hypothetical protein
MIAHMTLVSASPKITNVPSQKFCNPSPPPDERLSIKKTDGKIAAAATIDDTRNQGFFWIGVFGVGAFIETPVGRIACTAE